MGHWPHKQVLYPSACKMQEFYLSPIRGRAPVLWQASFRGRWKTGIVHAAHHTCFFQAVPQISTLLLGVVSWTQTDIRHQYASVPQGKQWCLRPAKLLHRTSTSWLDSTSFSHLQICSPFCTPAIVWLSTRHNIQNLGQNILFFLHVDGFWSQCLNRCSLGLLPNDSDFWSLEIAVALWSSRLVLSKTTPMGEGPWDCGTSCGHFFPILTAIAVRVDLNGLRNYSVTQVSSKASLNAPLRQPFQKRTSCVPRLARLIGHNLVFFAPMLQGAELQTLTSNNESRAG